MKLELKHLAPYLPYGLKNQRAFHKPKVIDGIVGNKVYFGDTVLFINQIEPILRPLSDLTKEIEVDGYKFIPYEDDYLSDVMCSYESLELLCEYNGNISNDSTIPYTIMSLLFQWHFDVFGLIDAGLAIDINTLN
tara:strand:+ start:117 stop:521 length:405 start_codon:yes stop_codon:yes gene_type:complete